MFADTQHTIKSLIFSKHFGTIHLNIRDTEDHLVNFMNRTTESLSRLLIKDSFLFFFKLQSFVGQPEFWVPTGRSRPSVSKPEAKTPGPDPHTMWTGELQEHNPHTSSTLFEQYNDLEQGCTNYCLYCTS